ncbi:hypothetical protein SH611_22215 [Geminicoccaceae bacterium 1502E]|nr:hypothetical protein [Geminicoccaceae bacterium 1502E]
MPQNSSTSSSETGWRRALGYLATAAASGLFLAAAIAVVNVLGARADLMSIPGSGLLHRQLAKLEGPEPIDILLVGDSSLGNTVIAEQWSEAMGETVVNAALTGRYGYVGSRNMIRRALRRHQPRMIVLVQTLDMATRKPSMEGDLLTAERWEDVELHRPWELVEELASLDYLLAMGDTLLGRIRPRQEEMERLDYVPQREELPSVAELLAKEDPLLVEDISPEKLAALEEIGALCRENGIPCLYAHGPLLDTLCSRSVPFTSAVNREIAARGFAVVPGTPVCLQPHEVGDQVDHPRESARAALSALYRSMVLETAGDAPATARLGSGGPGKVRRN